MLELRLEGLEVRLEAGARLGLTGAAGCGKSRLLRWLAGLGGATWPGERRIQGHDPERLSPAARLGLIGFVGSDPRAQLSGTSLTVRQEVAWGLENLAVPRPLMRQRVEEALQLCGLAELGERFPASLSGGEQQRLALAGVLALRPSLLLLDEPLAMVDPAGSSQLRQTLAALGLSVVWATSRLEEIDDCDSWLWLDPGGRPIYCGPPRLAGVGPLPAPWTRLAALAQPLGRWQGELPLREEELQKALRVTTGGPLPALPAGPTLVRLAGVSWGVLRELTLELRAGQFVALLGANGSGKTSLARLINGLELPEEGEVELAGVSTELASPPELAARAAYLFQDPRAQLFCPTLEEELCFGPRQLGWPEARVQAAVAAARLLTEMAHPPELNPLELPDSELRWVALTSVLALDAPLLILDEPDGSLDEDGWLRLHRFLDAWREMGRSLVLITHDLELAAQRCDRLLVLERGRLWGDGPPDQVFAGAEPPGLGYPLANRVARRHGLGSNICRDFQVLGESCEQ